MEKIQNRADYINEFIPFCKEVKLSEDFMKELKEHEYLRYTMCNINVSKYSIYFLVIEIYFIYNNDEFYFFFIVLNF
jgi:hypothetical protein